MRRAYACAFMLALPTIAGCFPVVAVGTGVGISSVDRGLHANLHSEIGGASLNSEWLGAAHASYYEGSRDIIAFGPSVGRLFAAGPGAVASLGVEAGPIVGGPTGGGSYYGLRGSIRNIALWSHGGQWEYLPLHLTLGAQYGRRKGTTDWNGPRLGGQLMLSFGIP